MDFATIHWPRPPWPRWPWRPTESTAGLDPGPGLGQGGCRLGPHPLRLPRHAEVRAQSFALGAQQGGLLGAQGMTGHGGKVDLRGPLEGENVFFFFFFESEVHVLVIQWGLYYDLR